MTPEEVYYNALTFTVNAFGNQPDKTGFPAVLHSVRVAEQFVLKNLEEMAVAALLHDTVEDTSVTLEEIGRKFGSDMKVVIDHLTHRKGQETYKEYIKRVSHNPVAVEVKLADIRDNLYRRGPVPSGLEKRYLDAIVTLVKTKELLTLNVLVARRYK